MKDYLEIKKFGPIKEVNIEIKELTIFIGTQGSGKSTISKLLTICRDVHWYIRILEKNDVLHPFVDFNINEYFQEDTYIHYYNSFTKIEVTYQNKEFSIRMGELSNNKLLDLANGWINWANEDLMNKSLTIPNEINTADIIENKVKQANSRMILYIPAERNLIGNLSSALASILSARIPLSDTIIEYMSLFEKAKKEFPKYEIPFLGVRYEKKDGEERIVLSAEGTDLPLNACSSGLQSVLPMIMVIDYALKLKCFDAFVIEEPEQNLFPKNQCELLAFITSKQNELTDKQFVITTHSPYLLSYLNVLMLAYKLYQHDIISKEVSEIVPPNLMVNPNSVAVYNLDPQKEIYCKSLIAERSGLISVNELDSVSEFIGDTYDRLYRLYIQTKKKK